MPYLLSSESNTSKLAPSNLFKDSTMPGVAPMGVTRRWVTKVHFSSNNKCTMGVSKQAFQLA